MSRECVHPDSTARRILALSQMRVDSADEAKGSPNECHFCRVCSCPNRGSGPGRGSG
eukprot:SAG31_NODE_9693_length_1241_cov_0.895797_3_plen_56_part_01